MKFTEAFKMMKQGAKSKITVMGWPLVLGSGERNNYDSVQTAGRRSGRIALTFARHKEWNTQL